MAFDLNSIRRAAALPPRIVIYGPEGVGKTTWACQAPSPVVIQTEDGLAGLDVDAFPLATRHQQVLDALTALYQQDHEYQTLVLDSVDWLEALIWRHVCERDGQRDIESYGYGKGYIVAASEMREVLAGLQALRTERGMMIILIAHSQVRRYDDPTAGSYDRYTLAMHKAATAVVMEWADVVGFASHPVRTRSDEGSKKKRAIAAGERTLHTERSPAFDAKSRYPIPAELALQWSAFAAAMGLETEEN